MARISTKTEGRVMNAGQCEIPHNGIPRSRPLTHFGIAALVYCAADGAPEP
jgi:hypothetical protein